MAPQHCCVLVNGLWGWQRDWNSLRRALDRHNDGSLLIHVSAVNVGPATYAGIDVCGQRLAVEVQQLVSSTPSLTTISFIGHSMGGLIARYAIGLLSDTTTGTVAGLQAGCYVSIASPHLGCSSSHPDEEHWQDRPYVRWLAAAVAAGHLGGHEHLALAAATANTSPDNAHAAADTGPSVPIPSPCNADSTGHGRARCITSSSSNSGSGRSWPWTPCRSVVQLLGCDAWRPTTDSISCCCRCQIRSCEAVSGQAGVASSGNSNKTCSSSSSSMGSRACRNPSSDCLVDCGAETAGGTSTGSKSDGPGQDPPIRRCCCHCSSPQLHVAPLQTGTDGSSSRSGGSGSSTQHSRMPEGKMHLLDILCQDVLITCQDCGAEAELPFLSGLQLFGLRANYSSAGGDHLIPWSSSSLLAPHALPVRAVKQAAASAADSTTQQLQLPVLGIWATKPLIVEHNVPPPTTHNFLQQPKQQQEQSGRDWESSAATASATLVTSDSTQSRQGTRELAIRLTQLQQMPWRRFHVIWPRLCLGSSHCNIQYNGPLNFVGHAVVEHVCHLLVNSSV